MQNSIGNADILYGVAMVKWRSDRKCNIITSFKYMLHASNEPSELDSTIVGIQYHLRAPTMAVTQVFSRQTISTITSMNLAQQDVCHFGCCTCWHVSNSLYLPIPTQQPYSLYDSYHLGRWRLTHTFSKRREQPANCMVTAHAASLGGIHEPTEAHAC